MNENLKEVIPHYNRLVLMFVLSIYKIICLCFLLSLVLLIKEKAEGASNMKGSESLLILCTCVGFILVLLKLLHKYWWKPVRIQKLMNAQGIMGPPYKFIHGNNKDRIKMMKEAMAKPLPLTHDILSKVAPHMDLWIQEYGKMFLSWMGCRAQLVVADPKLAKEILINKDRNYSKIKTVEAIRLVTGNGLVSSDGETWAKMRKIANHAFHGESLKSMSPAVIASVETMLERWKQYEGKQIEVFEEFRLLTSEIISRTAFGSSYMEGEKIFQIIEELLNMTFKSNMHLKFPFLDKIWRYSDEIEAGRLAKAIHNSVMQIVRKREENARMGGEEEGEFGSDFLGFLMKAHLGADEKSREQQLVDECKTFYFVGQKTTNSLLGWLIMVLAMHIEWQEKARKEVMEIFGDQMPHPEGISKLKIMTMIINETLRLYPMVLGQSRRVEKEVQLGNVTLPANMELIVLTMALHHDPDLWGDDAKEFKPERFSQGIAKATNTNAVAYLPFGMGPRSCVGMSFATHETKVALSMILQRYTFTLSPSYIHSPVMVLIHQPQYGIKIILYPINQTQA